MTDVGGQDKRRRVDALEHVRAGASDMVDKLEPDEKKRAGLKKLIDGMPDGVWASVLGFGTVQETKRVKTVAKRMQKLWIPTDNLILSSAAWLSRYNDIVKPLLDERRNHLKHLQFDSVPIPTNVNAHADEIFATCPGLTSLELNVPSMEIGLVRSACLHLKHLQHVCYRMSHNNQALATTLVQSLFKELPWKRLQTLALVGVDFPLSMFSTLVDLIDKEAKTSAPLTSLEIGLLKGTHQEFDQWQAALERLGKTCPHLERLQCMTDLIDLANVVPKIKWPKLQDLRLGLQDLARSSPLPPTTPFFPETLETLMIQHDWSQDIVHGFLLAVSKLPKLRCLAMSEFEEYATTIRVPLKVKFATLEEFRQLPTRDNNVFEFPVPVNQWRDFARSTPKLRTVSGSLLVEKEDDMETIMETKLQFIRCYVKAEFFDELPLKTADFLARQRDMVALDFDSLQGEVMEPFPVTLFRSLPPTLEQLVFHEAASWPNEEDCVEALIERCPRLEWLQIEGDHHVPAATVLRLAAGLTRLVELDVYTMETQSNMRAFRRDFARATKFRPIALTTHGGQASVPPQVVRVSSLSADQWI